VIFRRAQAATRLFGVIFIAAFALAGLWLSLGIDGYRITAAVDPNAVPNILGKAVERADGAWLGNYAAYPWMMLAPLAGFVGAVLAIVMSLKNRAGIAFLFSSLCLSGVILTSGFSLFPFIMPSSTDPTSSLTVWDAVSSHLTLQLMFWAVLIFLPLIILYTGWVYRVMRGKVTEQSVKAETNTLY
jgi:cytochrome d ubiquinol oxidase subunit II